jgi:hypothetical protein
MGSKSYDLFINYKSEDLNLASQLYEQLRDRKKAGELCGSRLTIGLRIESRIPFVELLSELFI